MEKKEKEIEQRSMDFDNKGANLWQQLYDVKRWCFGMFLQQQKRLKKVEFYGGITY
jgi:phage terminase large subunit-like protein